MEAITEVGDDFERDATVGEIVVVRAGAIGPVLVGGTVDVQPAHEADCVKASPAREKGGIERLR